MPKLPISLALWYTTMSFSFDFSFLYIFCSRFVDYCILVHGPCYFSACRILGVKLVTDEMILHVGFSSVGIGNLNQRF